jgi:uncharacterized protein YecE (DUF72 family)
MTGRAFVGTSGWVYPPWRGVFYPPKLPHKRELEYMSAHVSSVEINGTFYSLQRPTSFAAWSAQTPDDFLFSVKGPRYISHLKRLRDARIPLANFFASGPLALGPKLGPILWQLPPNFRFDPAVLGDFFDLLPRSTGAAATLAHEHEERLKDRVHLTADADRPIRYALEVRHDTFAVPAFLDLLREHDVAVVVADTAGKWPFLDAVTAGFAYARLHGDEVLYTSGYTERALDTWAARVSRWRAAGLDAHVYFDNDVKVRAPYDAMGLIARLS